jgi:hypothetical protein
LFVNLADLKTNFDFSTHGDPDILYLIEVSGPANGPPFERLLEKLKNKYEVQQIRVSGDYWAAAIYKPVRVRFNGVFSANIKDPNYTFVVEGDSTVFKRIPFTCGWTRIDSDKDFNEIDGQSYLITGVHLAAGWDFTFFVTIFRSRKRKSEDSV